MFIGQQESTQEVQLDQTLPIGRESFPWIILPRSSYITELGRLTDRVTPFPSKASGWWNKDGPKDLLIGNM